MIGLWVKGHSAYGNYSKLCYGLLKHRFNQSDVLIIAAHYITYLIWWFPVRFISYSLPIEKLLLPIIYFRFIISFCLPFVPSPVMLFLFSLFVLLVLLFGLFFLYFGFDCSIFFVHGRDTVCVYVYRAVQEAGPPGDWLVSRGYRNECGSAGSKVQ